MADFDKELDTSGMHCPFPIFKTKEALSDMTSGQVLHVISDDPGSIKNFSSFVEIFSAAYNRSESLELLESTQEESKYHYLIKLI